MAKAKKTDEKPKKSASGKKGKDKAAAAEKPIVMQGVLKENVLAIEAKVAEKKALDLQIKAHKNVLKDNGYPTTKINAFLRRRKMDDAVRIDHDMEIHRMEVEMGMETWVQAELALEGAASERQNPEAAAQKIAAATGKPTPVMPSIKVNPAFAPADNATKEVTH